MNDPPIDADDDDAATPLTPDERVALIPTYIAQRHELNEVEQIGIADADRWAFARNRPVLEEKFLRQLHKRMFGKVWKWAGEFCKTPRNLGVAPWKIAPDLRQLLDEARYWVEHETYPADELAVRFHHRLVSIHPFPNGNGRHARLAADLLVVHLGRARFTWGSGNLAAPVDLRRRYIGALRAADGLEIGKLVAFARS